MIMPQEVGPGRVFELLQGRGLDLTYVVAGHAERCRDGVEGVSGTTRDAEAHRNDPGRRFLERAEHGTHLGFQLPVEDNFGGSRQAIVRTGYSAEGRS